MKKIFGFVIVVFFIFIAYPVWSQTTSPTDVPEPTVTKPEPTEDLDDEVDKLKEKVAEKVSELSKNEDRVTSGVVSKVADSSLTLGKNEIEISIDDTLTTYYEVQGSAIREIKQDDIAKNDYIFVIGPEINGVITANAVYKDQKYMVISGKITKVNQSDFSIEIVSLDKTAYTLDIQTQTTQRMLNIKSLAIEAIGFSKLKEGDAIHVVVKSDSEKPEATRFDAERLLIVPNEYFIQ